MDLPLLKKGPPPSSSKLQVVLKQLCTEGCETLSNWRSLVDIALSLANSLAQSLCMDASEKVELERLAIDLWNKTSVMKSTGNLHIQLYAKLRHISFQVVTLLNESANEDKTLKKQIVMGLKTVRGWLDSKELEFADSVLRNLNQISSRLQCIIVERKNSSTNDQNVDKEKAEVELDILHILCVRAEVSFAQGQFSDAMSAMLKAKQLVSKFPSEGTYFSMLCYNFGVDCYQEKNLESAVEWLRESYDLGKDSSEVSHKTQARTLRLLANCYIEWACDGWQDNALNAVTLANKECVHPAGLYLKLQLLVLSQEGAASIIQVFDELLKHPDCTMDLCLNVMQLLKKNNRSEVVYGLRHDIVHKFEMHPDAGQLLVTIMDLFIHSPHDGQAKGFTEECITAHNTSQRLDAATIKQFHILLWGKAAQCYEKEEYVEAVTWYNYSLSLYPSMSQSEPNLGKLHRNLATCYLNLGEIHKAHSAIEIAELCEPRSAHTLYIAFRIALDLEDTDKALSSLCNLVECVPKGKNCEDSNIICLAAHLALEREKTKLAIPALECLISHCPDEKRVITALRCLLRLLLSHMEDDKSVDIKAMLVHVRTAYNKLVSVKDKGDLPSAELEEEASWFMKITWNLALEAKDDPFSMKEFFNLCYQLLPMCGPDVGNRSRQQNCLLMSCAACLHLARDPSNNNILEDLLEEVLHHVEEYRQAHRTAHNSLWAQGSVKNSASADMFVLMYEFEALTKLKDQRAEAVLEKAFTLPNSEPRLFHTLAALAVNPPAASPRLSMRALKVAVRQHLQAETPDFVSCSVDVRNLIELSLSASEEEALTYFKETLDIIEKRAQENYPEMEVLWLMTRCWNCGLHRYNCEQFTEAEQWCSLSMRFLKYLPTLRGQYESQMTSLYGQILQCLETHTSARMEE